MSNDGSDGDLRRDYLSVAQLVVVDSHDGVERRHRFLADDHVSADEVERELPVGRHLLVHSCITSSYVESN